MRNLDVALLRTFIQVTESGSMTVAASRLHLTQGAVSQQIKRLEELLGCSLLKRDKQKTAPTADGKRLLAQASRLVALNDEIWAEMRTPDIAGQVRLGVPFDLVSALLSRTLHGFSQSHPKVDISIISGSSADLAGAMAKGKVDLAIIEEPAATATGDWLSTEKLVWVAKRGGSAYSKRPLPLCLVSDTCVFRPAIFDALKEKQIECRIVFDNASIEATAATVRADLAVTAWLASTVPADLEILKNVSGLPPLPDYSVMLHMPGGGSSAPVAALAEAIKRTYPADGVAATGSYLAR